MTMTTTEMLPLLQTWAKRHEELSAPMDKLVDVFGGSYEGPLFDAVWNVWDDYTATLSNLIGDKHQWLMWFHAENDMGAKGLPVRVGETTMTLRTLQDLAAAIVTTHGRSRAPIAPAQEDLEIELSGGIEAGARTKVKVGTQTVRVPFLTNQGIAYRDYAFSGELTDDGTQIWRPTAVDAEPSKRDH